MMPLQPSAESFPFLTAGVITMCSALILFVLLKGADRKAKNALRRKNAELAAEISARKRTEEELRESESRYRMLVEHQSEGISFIGPDGRFLFVNSSGGAIFGSNPARLIGRNVADFLTDGDPPSPEEMFPRNRSDAGGGRDLDIFWPTGERRTISWNGVPWFNDDGRYLGEFGTFRDITEQKRSEERIATALKEKELLLKELHHKVRANMFDFCGLLGLSPVHDAKTGEIVKASQERIRSMALIHDELCRSEDSLHIDFARYARGLAASLQQSYEVTDVVVSVAADDVPLSLDTALQVGLILNELIANSLKHAFRKGRGGRISISMNTEDQGKYLLSVQDNGIGLPRDIDWRAPTTPGLQIVSTLIGKLRGAYEVKSDEGTRYLIRFLAS